MLHVDDYDYRDVYAEVIPDKDIIPIFAGEMPAGLFFMKPHIQAHIERPIYPYTIKIKTRIHSLSTLEQFY